jgi:hypothetical protein
MSQTALVAGFVTSQTLIFLPTAVLPLIMKFQKEKA